jgi:hypothetical protein
MLHFTLIIVYTNPLPHTKSKIDYYAEWYVYPYFTQNWSLFAPTPTTNYNLFVEYNDNGLQKVDVFNELLLQHQGNRFKGRGSVLLAFTNSIHYFEKTTKKLGTLNGPITDDLYFEMIVQETLNYIRSTRKIKIEAVKIQLVVQSIDLGKSRVYYN